MNESLDRRGQGDIHEREALIYTLTKSQEQTPFLLFFENRAAAMITSGFIAYSAQSSYLRLGTRANSRRLWVIRMSFRLKEWAAIRRSIFPISVPFASR